MIDLHTHILPDMDDGAMDMYDTIEMAKLAVAGGATAVAATPHCNIPGMYRNYWGEEYIERFKDVERLLKEEDIPLTLYAGMEVYVTEDLPELLYEGKILTINGSHNMLVEFGFDEDVDYVDEMLDKIKELGIRPLIAHPERYTFVQRNLQKVYEWRQKGFLIQVNKGSLMGRFGRRAYNTARMLLAHNLITVIASDAHGPYTRTPYMKDLYEELKNEYSEKYLDVLFKENPLRICKDKPTIKFAMHPFEEE